MSVFSDSKRLSAILQQMGYSEVLKEYSVMAQNKKEKEEIPGFYISHKTKSENLASIINSWATTQSILKIKEKYPTMEDVDKIEAEFKRMSSTSSFPSLGARGGGGRTLRYPQYLQLREVWDDDLKPILSSSLFIEVGGTSMHTCNYDALIQHLTILARCSEHYSYLQSLDLSRSGYITNDEFKEYVKKYAFQFSFLQYDSENANDNYTSQEELMKLYVEFASQQFLVVLDPLSSGKVMIAKILNDVLFMFFVMVDGWTEERQNPFSLEVLNSFVKDFKNIDFKKTGILEPDSLLYMNRLRFTQAFVNRATETISFNNGVMNFEWYVRFRVAWFSVGEPFANAYFFDAIDIDGDGFITQNEMNYFQREIDKATKELYPEEKNIPPYDFVVSQHFDMCQASDQRISRKMFVEAKSTEGLLRRLCDIRDFTQYELSKDCGCRQLPVPDVFSL
ncbi:EF hand family protein [Tritrichomonas foetus]|uniref:EF hand family protein n=1 Tax=Tritrichomonas foetus TaxID=1144522 RepID=A0A1J4L3L0_9EUKA|nr:EF hand family protein [Tritrichomonas foetus]|eukprot:OHT17664.1 EF hand family protein [Tritrichomonas foetus]